MTKLQILNRIALLRTRNTDNSHIIRKLERKLRKMEAKEQ
jgi:hypothetical protein